MTDSDNDLFSSDSDYDEIEETETPFWEKIELNKYDLQLDIQKSIFLIDLLEDLYKFKLENNKIIIYEKKNNGIEEIVEKDKIVYFLHIELIKLFKEARFNLYYNNGKNIYNSINYFKEVNTIYQAIDNMKVYFKYFKNNTEEKDNVSDKEKKTKKCNNVNLNILRPTIL